MEFLIIIIFGKKKINYILETNLLKMLQNLRLKFGCRLIFLALFYIVVSKLLLVIIISYETNL